MLKPTMGNSKFTFKIVDNTVNYDRPSRRKSATPSPLVFPLMINVWDWEHNSELDKLKKDKLVVLTMGRKDTRPDGIKLNVG